MLSVVQAQAPDRLDVLGRERTEKQSDVGDILRDVVFAKDVAGDHPGLPRSANIRGTPGQDGISVVGPAVLCEEADQALSVI